MVTFDKTIKKLLCSFHTFTSAHFLNKNHSYEYTETFTKAPLNYYEYNKKSMPKIYQSRNIYMIIPVLVIIFSTLLYACILLWLSKDCCLLFIISQKLWKNFRIWEMEAVTKYKADYLNLISLTENNLDNSHVTKYS